MAIKDLQTTKPGLARAGVIRLGYKVKKNGKEYPTPSDHFVLKDAPGVAEALGNERPKELRIYLPFDDIDLVLPAYHQYWVASALVCRGDGESIQYAINPNTGQVVIRDGVAIADFESGKTQYKAGQHMPCPGMTHDLYPKCQHCKPNAMLIVMLRDVPRLAYYQIATTSIHNIIGLTEQLTYIKQTIGRLQGVPFILKLAPRKISVPKSDGKGRMRTEKYLLSLEVDPEWVQSLMTAQRQLSAPERKLLAATIDEEEIIDVEPAKPAVSTVHTFVEPPVWFPPNGSDDSGDYEAEDWQMFAAQVCEALPFYGDIASVGHTMEALELVYDPENEQHIFDTLAEYAEGQGVGQTKTEDELPF
jgi:hypothetical protein